MLKYTTRGELGSLVLLCYNVTHLGSSETEILEAMLIPDTTNKCTVLLRSKYTDWSWVHYVSKYIFFDRTK